MLAQWDDVSAVRASLSFGLLASLIGLITILLWLEWGPRRGALWVWLPLALPALPLVSGQYRVALWLGIDGQYAAVLWSHLLWVLPWMLLILQPARRRIDPRLLLTARTLGWRRTKVFCLIKCPLLLRPALLALQPDFRSAWRNTCQHSGSARGVSAPLPPKPWRSAAAVASRFWLTGRCGFCW